MDTLRILDVSGLHAYYGHSHVLQGVDLEVREGSVVGLVGRNGMGKTTLIHAVAGLVPVSSGRVHVSDTPIHTLQAYEIARLGVALVPQGRRVFRSLSVDEHLRVATSRLNGKATYGKPDSEGWPVSRVYAEFPELEARRTQMAGSLSGGEAQMLAIARALVRNPRLMLMDEPSEGLAPLVVERVRGIIESLADTGLSILLVEQHFKLAMSVSERIYVLASGRIVFEGTPQALASEPQLASRHLGV